MSWLAALLCFNWLGQSPATRAWWCLPLAALVYVGLLAEKTGHVRWALPFYLVAGITLVFSLDTIALKGTSLGLIGLNEIRVPFFNVERQELLSLALNGYLFVGLMLWMERSQSLDLRRASRIIEPIALLHILGALYWNAQNQRNDALVAIDAILYVVSVSLILVFAARYSRWRTLLGALGGIALGSHLLLDLDLVPRIIFALILGIAGILLSISIEVYRSRAVKRKLVQ